MKLYGLTLLELEGIVAEVSRNNYKGNLELNRAEQSPRVSLPVGSTSVDSGAWRPCRAPR